MGKIGIIICNRYANCGGGKCLRAMRERKGAFAMYPANEPLELVGYTNCGGCPGGNIEYAPTEMIKNGAEVIHLATGMIVGYPPCPNIKRFKDFIKVHYSIPVILGTHPIPMKYYTTHTKLNFWKNAVMESLCPELLQEKPEIMKSYD